MMAMLRGVHFRERTTGAIRAVGATTSGGDLGGLIGFGTAENERGELENRSRERGLESLVFADLLIPIFRKSNIIDQAPYLQAN